MVDYLKKHRFSICFFSLLFSLLILISTGKPINLFLTMGQTSQHTNLQNHPEGQVLWDRYNDVDVCMQYYCNENKGIDFDGDCSSCLYDIDLGLEGSCIYLQKSNSLTWINIYYQTFRLEKSSHPIDCSFMIPNPPKLVSQKEQIGLCNSYTCWFAAITMMLSYRDNISYSTGDILDMLDSYYQNLFLNNSRISSIDFAYLVGKLGLFKSHVDLTPKTISDMLQKYGPIMVTTMEPGNSLHVRLIIGISQYCSTHLGNTKLYFLDPEDPNNGKPTIEKYPVFEEKFLNGSRFIVHL